MKTILSFLMLCATTISFAQDNFSKIPQDASIVASIKGKNLFQLLSMEELDNSMMAKEMLKEISDNNNTYTSLNQLGLDLENTAHYFYQSNDSIFYNTLIIPIKNIATFETFLKDKNKTITTVNGVKTTENNRSEATVWDNNNFVFVYGSLVQSYFDQKEIADRYGLTYYDQSLYAEEDVEYLIKEDQEDNYEEDYNEEDNYDEDYNEEEDDTLDDQTYDNYSNGNSDYEIKSKLEEQWSFNKAAQVLNSQQSYSILDNNKFSKSLDQDAEASIWIGDFQAIYKSFMPYSYYTEFSGFDMSKMYADTGLYANLYLEEDLMKLEATYTMSPSMANSYKKMTSRPLNKKFLNYINEDNLIAYLSYAMDTEETLKEYPKLIKEVYKNLPNYAEEASLGIDLFSLLLDEKAVADVLKGDMLFLLSGLSSQEVTYTTYQYNEDYEYEEVEKTKNETIPDFLLMASTEDPTIINKVLDYTRNKQLVTYSNGLYKIQVPKSPLSMYFVIKDDIIFLGTNQLEMTKILNGTFKAKLSSTHKKLLTKNTSSMFFSPKQLAKQLSMEEMNMDKIGKFKWFLNNTEDAYFKTSKIKGNAIQTEMVIKVPSNQENALKYIFNTIEELAK